MLTAVSSPDLHLLRVFIAVTECGGFSRAQIALNVSQSTISTQMADLESRLGMKLCRRGRAGFLLTDEGHKVYTAAKALFSNCEEFVGQINMLRGEVAGELRIAMADALLAQEDFRMDDLITEARQRMPSVKLQLNVMEPLEIERLVLEQRLHTGIHTFPNHSPGLRYRTLFYEEQVLYCGRDHPLFKMEQFPGVESIEEYDYAYRTYYGGTLRPGNFQPRKNSASSSNMDGIIAFILSGKFLGHLPVEYARPWVERGQLRAILPELLSYKTRFESVSAVGTRVSRAHRILEELISKHLSKHSEASSPSS